MNWSSVSRSARGLPSNTHGDRRMNSPHRLSLVFLVFLLGLSAWFSIEADAADSANIYLESGVIEASERAAKQTAPDGTETPLDVNLTENLQKMGLTRAEPAYYIVRVKGPRVASVKEQIQKAGGEVLGYAQFYAFIVKMDGNVLGKVASIGTVEWIGTYKPEYRITRALKARLDRLDREPEAAKSPDALIHPTGSRLGEARKATEQTSEGKSGDKARSQITVDVYLFSNAGVDAVSDFVRQGGGTLDATVKREHLHKVRATVPIELVEPMSLLPDVRIIREYVPEVLFNDVGATIMGVPEVWNTHGLTGTNQIVGHADSGLDTGTFGTGMNADFRSRIAAAFPLGRAGDWSDFGGHGTHTAGSILGNGANSTGDYKGIAYEAQLVHQSVGDADGGLGGIPADYGDLFEQAYTNGARLHSDSWGADVGGAYGSSVELDTWAWNSGSPRDMLLVVAAGNAGPNANTVGSPGTAKNCLTVGASETYRPGVGSNGDNTNEIASFSSRGATDEGRIKPDVVAPGTWIASVKTHGYTTAFTDDMESGVGSWVEEGPSGPAATPWVLDTGDARSPVSSWHYATSATFDDYLVCPAVAVPDDAGSVYVRFRWKGTLGANSQVGIAYRTVGGSWNLPSSYSTGPLTNSDWVVKTWEITSSLHGQTLEFGIDTYGTAASSAADFRVDDFEVTTFASWGDMSLYGLASFNDSIDTNYTLMGGTSMATPLTAGAAALVRQFYGEEKGHDPSAALMKATLINGATDMTPATPRPDNNEGWGCVNLEYSLFPPAPRTFLFYDTTNGLAEGQSDAYDIKVTNASETLRATLVWSDPPGATLQNDLNLLLVAPNAATTNRSDSINNVEGVDVASPQTGRWLVQVSGETLADGPQPYAVIISGAVSAGDGLDAPSDFSAVASGTSSVSLSWAKNASTDDVVIAANTNDVFGTPTDGVSYSTGDALGGSTVIYAGAATTTQHTNLLPSTRYHYRAWSVNGSLQHSAASATAATTLAPPVSLPYTESFETAFGAWTNASDDDGNWTRQSGSTPSTSTGPSAAQDGSYYIYTESSSGSDPGYPNKTASLEFSANFAEVASPALTFYYHMYGAAMGNLYVDVYDGTWHMGIWSRSGQQHTSYTDPWTQAVVDLSAYGNLSSVKIRIRGVTGSNYTSDMAVDNVSVYASVLQIVTDTLPVGTVGGPYLATLEAANGTPPYIWSIESGSLQAGLSLSTNGTISGTPAEAGTNQITFSVEDDEGSTTNKSLQLAVYPPELDHFEWSAIASQQVVNVPFYATITARDGNTNILSAFSNSVSLSGWIGQAGSAAGANLDFESGVLDPWIPLNASSDPGPYQITNFDVAGQGQVSKAFRIAPNSGTPDGIEQPVTLQAGNTYTIRVDIAESNEAGGSNGGVRWVRLYVAATEIDGFSFFDTMGNIPGGQTFRTNLLGTYTPPTNGTYALKLTFERPWSEADYIWAYADNVSVSSLDAGTEVLIAPTNSGNFVNGVWTGMVSVLETATNMYLRADDGSGHMGDSATFSVATGAITRTLTVVSAHGGAYPGTQTVDNDTALSQYVTNSPMSGGVGTQYVCTAGTVVGNDYTPVSPTNVTLTLTNDATLTWHWSTQYWCSVSSTAGGAVVAPNGWYWAGSSAVATAVPLSGFVFTNWTGDVPLGHEGDNPLTLSMDQARFVTAQFLVNTNEIAATHACDGYYSPSTSSTVSCSFSYPGDQSLTSLTWAVSLPGGWSLLSASGDGSPAVAGTNILFSGALTNNPLAFVYWMNVPEGQGLTNQIGGAATFQFECMSGTASVPALPSPLDIRRYNRGDYRDPQWKIDAFEASKLLGYWRAGSYHIEPSEPDGYDAGPGDTNGPCHSADYQSPYWKIDSFEASKVLGYWRAGAYHADPSQLDGYEAGP